MEQGFYWRFFFGIFLFTVALFVLMALVPLEPRKSDAMKVCELSHSHEVCFSTLNR